MAQGTRGRVWRVAVAGIGALLCGGLAGCLNTDKPKNNKVPTKPGIGLPGTPTLQTGGTANKTGTPTGAGTGASGAFAGAGANLQQSRAGTTGQNWNTGTGGTGIQQTGGFANPGGVQPGFGAGAISPPTPPSGAFSGSSVPPPNMTAPVPQWGTNYPPAGSGPANPVQPPMNDIAPPPPLGAPSASVLPPQPSVAAPTGFGVLPPSAPN